MTTSNFSGPLADDLAGFLARLRDAGAASASWVKQLRTLDRFTQDRLLPLRTIDEATARAWLAPSATRGPNTMHGRYCLLRRFCRFLATHRPGTFIPGETLRPRQRPAAPPHIYSRDEIRLLLAGASTLRDWERGHPCRIRSKTMHGVILLLVTSGLRISEALRLTLQDVDLDHGVLSIRQTKFRKSRLVPVSSGTLAILRRYHDLRSSVVPSDPNGPFFISGRKRAYSTATITTIFHDIAVRAGIHPPKGRGPRLHDLRATFAVTRLLLWYREGANVMARLPMLTTYLGHACVSDTEVYLPITTALLDEANSRFHAFAEDLLPPGGRP
jgi:integrase